MTSEARSPAGSPATKRPLRLSLSPTDILVLALVMMLAYGHLWNLSAGNWVSALFFLQQITIIVFMLLHRPLKSARVPWNDILLGWGGTLLPFAMEPNGAPPHVVGNVLVVIGSLLATGAILSLGRSLGMEAGNRGIQTHGLYRYVRHPIYAAYLPLIGGYLLSYPSWWNALVFVAWMAFQVARIRREEAVLGQDEQYQAYAQRVHHRLIPGVW